MRFFHAEFAFKNEEIKIKMQISFNANVPMKTILVNQGPNFSFFDCNIVTRQSFNSQLMQILHEKYVQLQKQNLIKIRAMNEEAVTL